MNMEIHFLQYAHSKQGLFHLCLFTKSQYSLPDTQILTQYGTKITTPRTAVWLG
jgi:hypothetical protein